MKNQVEMGKPPMLYWKQLTKEKVKTPMLMILLLWSWMFTAAFVTGFAVLTPVRRKKRRGSGGYRIRSTTSYLMAGLCALTVYAGYFSLFAGVGLLANGILAVFVIGASLLLRKEIVCFWRQKRQETGQRLWLLYGFLVLLMAYGSSRGFLHYDTGLYHAQSIRWIEEYGVVPGLANLHSRFGYNSAAFLLCALFGGRGYMPQPMHCAAGFFGLIVAVQCCGLRRIWTEKKVRISHFLRMGAIYYVVTVFRELVSPASDYFVMLLVFFICIRWMDLLEEGEKEVTPYALLSLLLVYAATVKLSAAVLLLLVLHPAVLLIREKRWKEILLYLALGTGIALPYLIRNVLISGWLFYPLTICDWFDVDWKIEKGYAQSDATEIQVYARQIYDVLKADLPFRQWVPNWFANLKGMEKVWVIASAVSACSLLTDGAAFALLGQAARGKKRREPSGCGKTSECGKMSGCGKTSGTKDGAVKVRNREKAPFAAEMTRLLTEKTGIALYDWCLFAVVLAAGFVFWFCSAPLVRYGYAYVILPAAFLGGSAACVLLGDWRRGILFCELITVAFLLHKGYNLTVMTTEMASQPYYFYQRDYGTYPAEVYEVDGVTVYVPVDRGQIGYDKFPSSPIVQDIELRGEGLEDGFRQKTD